MMTLVHGECLDQLLGPQKSWSLSLATERLITVSDTLLPTSSPGAASAQISYTVQASDLAQLPSEWTCDYVAIVMGSGHNNDAVGRLVTGKLYKNGVTSNGPDNVTMAASSDWSFDYPSGTTDVKVGDVLALELYCTTAGHNVVWNTALFQLWPTHLRPKAQDGRTFAVANCSFDTWSYVDVSQAGITNLHSAASYYLNQLGGRLHSFSSATTFPVYFGDATYGMGRLNAGEVLSTSGSTTLKRWNSFYGFTAWSGRLFRPRVPR